MAIPYYHVDAFTGELFAANPTGVCILSAFLADSIMQKIAAENRHSETAFVVPRADGDFDLRWFTPKVEDDLCAACDPGIRLCARAAETQGLAGSFSHPQRHVDRRSGHRRSGQRQI
jgi:PhzF family phenazine biosynthesis protein